MRGPRRRLPSHLGLFCGRKLAGVGFGVRSAFVLRRMNVSRSTESEIQVESDHDSRSGGSMLRSKQECLLITCLMSTVMVSVSLAQTVNQEEQTGRGDSVDFNHFMAATRQAKFEDYARRPGAKVANEKEFEKMKQHILSMYDGVKVKNSF